MALVDFQSALGELVQSARLSTPTKGLSSRAVDLSGAERLSLDALEPSPGLHLTMAVHRSWCEGRAARAARLTLSALPAAKRRQLLEEWVNRGGGTASFFAAEADGFLTFLERHLPEPSHIRTLCELERATIRASEGATDFVSPACPWITSRAVLRRGRHASLVNFHAEPSQLIPAFYGEAPLPPVSPDPYPMCFAPGIEGLCRQASDEEASLWRQLSVISSASVLVEHGHQPVTIVELLARGVIEHDVR